MLTDTNCLGIYLGRTERQQCREQTKVVKCNQGGNTIKTVTMTWKMSLQLMEQ